MIIDTSALVAILYQEDDAGQFANAILIEPMCRMSNDFTHTDIPPYEPPLSESGTAA